MKTLETIHEEIEKLGEVDLFGTRKEVDCLPEIMKESEHILYLTSGLMDNTTWLIVCTEERIILVDKGMFFGMKQSEMSLDKINSISYTTGFFLGSIEIWHNGAKMVIENCDKATVKKFVDTVKEAMEKKSEKTEAKHSSSSAASNVDDIASQLEKLAALMEKGILTKEEFDVQKKKLLGM